MMKKKHGEIRSNDDGTGHDINRTKVYLPERNWRKISAYLKPWNQL